MNNFISNNIYRNSFVIELVNLAISNVNNGEDNIIKLYAIKLKNIFENDKQEKYRNFIMTALIVSFIDTYKILEYKNKSLLITEEEKIILCKLKTINSYEDLLIYAFGKEENLSILLKYVLEFYRMNDLQKNLIVNNITPLDTFNMSLNYPLIENDLIEYNYGKDISLDFITNYYKKEMKSYEDVEMKSNIVKNPNIYSYEKEKEIVNYLKNLSSINKSVYNDTIEAILEYNYKWLKYLELNNYRVDSINEESSRLEIEFYEATDIEALIDDTLYDQTRLEEIIDLLLLLKCDNAYIDEKIVNEDAINDYFEANVRNL